MLPRCHKWREALRAQGRRSAVRLDLSFQQAAAAADTLGIPSQIAGSHGFRPLLAHPELAVAVSALLSRLMRGVLSARHRELIILRTAWLTRSEYEYAQHVATALDVGLSVADIEAVADPERHEDYSALDLAVLRAAEQLHRSSMIDEDCWAELEKQLAPAALMEVIFAAGFWRMVAGWLNSNQTTLEEAMCRLPADD